MKKGGGSECTIIIGPSKSVLVYTLHSLEYVLGVPRRGLKGTSLYKRLGQNIQGKLLNSGEDV